MDLGHGEVWIGVPVRCYMGCTNSGSGSLGVLEMIWMDGPSFSLCAAPLESSGPEF